MHAFWHSTGRRRGPPHPAPRISPAAAARGLSGTRAGGSGGTAAHPAPQQGAESTPTTRLLRDAHAQGGRGIREDFPPSIAVHRTGGEPTPGASERERTLLWSAGADSPLKTQLVDVAILLTVPEHPGARVPGRDV